MPSQTVLRALDGPQFDRFTARFGTRASGVRAGVCVVTTPARLAEHGITEERARAFVEGGFFRPRLGGDFAVEVVDDARHAAMRPFASGGFDAASQAPLWPPERAAPENVGRLVLVDDAEREELLTFFGDRDPWPGQDATIVFDDRRLPETTIAGAARRKLRRAVEQGGDPDVHVALGGPAERLFLELASRFDAGAAERLSAEFANAANPLHSFAFVDYERSRISDVLGFVEVPGLSLETQDKNRATIDDLQERHSDADLWSAMQRLNGSTSVPARNLSDGERQACMLLAGVGLCRCVRMGEGLWPGSDPRAKDDLVFVRSW
jgi:hypothetical protein